MLKYLDKIALSPRDWRFVREVDIVRSGSEVLRFLFEDDITRKFSKAIGYR